MADEKEEKYGNSDQPLPNPRPAILPAKDFDDNMAKKAAKELREAMKGFGTNEQKIIKVTEAFSHPQRMKILATFKQEFGRDLIKDLKSELSGNFEKLCVGFWRNVGEYDAELIQNACSGLGTNEDVLTEVICTRTNAQIEQMKAAWSQKKGLIDTIKSETSKNYRNLLVALLEGSRPNNGPVDEDAAKLDAETLHRVLSQEKGSDAKEKFVDIFTTRSWSQIREISSIFQDVSKKYTLTGAIDKTFGNSDTAKALLAIDEFAGQPYDYWAKKLRKAFKGMGTDDDQLRRVLITRAEIDLRDIAVVFGQRYGDGKTLNKWIKDDLSGDYEKLCLAVCGLD